MVVASIGHAPGNHRSGARCARPPRTRRASFIATSSRRTSSSPAMDRSKILDFGLAHVRERSFNQRLTRTGMVMGTSTYMPPEQARAQWKMVDARSDIWAIGATMFRALTGRHVHHSAVTQIERMLAAMSQHARRSHRWRRRFPMAWPCSSTARSRFKGAIDGMTRRAMQKALRYAYRALEKLGAPPLAPLGSPCRRFRPTRGQREVRRFVPRSIE